jgi:hypothetical protein
MLEKFTEDTDWTTKFADKDPEFYKQIVTTIKDHGEQLFFAENKEIVFKDWNGATHRDLASLLGSQKVKDDFEGGKLFKKILYILQFMCIKFAGKDLWLPAASGNGYKEAMKESERKNFIASHHETDVLLAYILLHIASRGEIMSVSIETDNERVVPVEFDLRQIEFTGSDKQEDSLFYYKLHRPINIRGKQVTFMILGPCAFNQIADTPFSGNSDKSNYDPISYLSSSIYYVPELQTSKVIINSSELNKLCLNDLKKMREQLAKHYTGINMIVEFEDQELQTKFMHYLPWYDASFLI